MKLEGLNALKFLSTHANKDNQIVGESMDVKFSHTEFSLEYSYCECTIFEMKYDDVLMKNYVNFVIVKQLFNDTLPAIVPSTLYQVDMIFKSKKKGRIFKIKSKDLRHEKEGKVSKIDGKMNISLEISDLILEFEPTNGEQESLLKGQF